jgi:hypothetical protein
VTMNIDSELNSVAAVATPLPANAPGYGFDITAANLGGCQYLGLTVSGTMALGKIRMLALRGTADRPLMQ